MALTLELPDSFPVEIIPEPSDVKKLVEEQNWAQLDSLPVCVDRNGKVVARFGQMSWNCAPYSTVNGEKANHQNLYFEYLRGDPGLLLQTKIAAYGWLYYIGQVHGNRCKLSTIATRINMELKRTLQFLRINKYDNFKALNAPETWGDYEEYLRTLNLSANSIKKSIGALNAISRINDWYPFDLILPDINICSWAEKLASPATKKKQHLAIPQSLADIIYGEAVKMVEQAWPHREKIAQFTRESQVSYEAGKAEVEAQIKSGKLADPIKTNGKKGKNRYQIECIRRMPKSYEDITSSALKGTGLFPPTSIYAYDLKDWLGLLQTACFTCCGGFTGMRISELYDLQKDSFFTYTVDNQIFTVVRANTHKLTAGKKHEEWLASPVVKKAIELAISITASNRDRLQEIAKKSSNPIEINELKAAANCLWLKPCDRTNRPGIILRSNWGARFKRFSERVGAVVDDASLAECRLLNPQFHGVMESFVTVGKPWPLTTHQFRRTFAVFSVRNHLGHPISIKQQFKHLYLRMSEWYGNGAVPAKLKDVQVDTDLQQLLNEAETEHTATSYDRWFNGDDKLTGSYGKAIVSMRDDKPVIYSSWDNLYRLVKEGRLTLHGTLHSYCKNGYDCSLDGVANPAFCVECKSIGSVIDTEKAHWWEKRHKALTKYLSEQNQVSPSEYSHCITQIRAAESVMRDHQLEYQKYQQAKEVVSL